jgi:hypothetical protein
VRAILGSLEVRGDTANKGIRIRESVPEKDENPDRLSPVGVH